MPISLASFEPGGIAVVIGASGGLGSALVEAISATGAFERVVGLSRQSEPRLDLADEASIAHAAGSIRDAGVPPRLILVATGFLHGGGVVPEKSWRHLSAPSLEVNFAVNAIGPALVAKHFMPLLPRHGKSVFAALSAKVGSIGDNRLGGWYGYRASKAALNQIIHTAAIELGRTHPEAVCVTLHPGTVQTALSQPFRGVGHPGDPPGFAAERLLQVIDGLEPDQSGALIDHTGAPLPF